MDDLSVHFTGETVVWRGPWHQEVPLDFHLFINPQADPALKDKAAMVIAKFLSTNWVEEQEELCTIEDEDEDYSE